MKILVTGARGFIGKAVVKKLSEKGIDWVAFSGDVRRMEDFESYRSCDHLLHLAGIIRPGPAREQQQHLLDVNLGGTYNAIRFAQEHSLRVILASSCCYTQDESPPHRESTPVTYFDPYTFTKWAGEKTLKAFHDFFKTEGVIVRMFNPYGPEQPAGFLIPDIINMIKQQRLVLQTIDAVRDFVYVDDIAELFSLVLTTRHPGLHVINAGSGRGTSIDELLDIIFERIGWRLPMEVLGITRGVQKSIANTDQAQRLFGWQSRTSLRDGLTNILQYHGLLT